MKPCYTPRPTAQAMLSALADQAGLTLHDSLYALRYDDPDQGFYAVAWDWRCDHLYAVTPQLERAAALTLARNWAAHGFVTGVFLPVYDAEHDLYYLRTITEGT